NAQAAEYYESAIRAYEEENRRLDAAIGRIRDGNLLEALLEREEDERAGWFWQLENLPDAPEARYLYVAFACHEFPAGLKNYRDLAFLGRTLERWSGSMAAFTDMIEARDRAHAQRLPRVDTLLAAESAERAQRERREIEARLDAIEAQHDVAALGSPEEREQW